MRRKRNKEIDSDRIVKQLRKTLKKTTVTVLKDPKYISTVVDGISTQCLALDLIIGRPGVPVGRLTEVTGLEGHSKSTTAAHLLAEVQRRGGVGVLFDTESGFDIERSEAMGIDTSKLITLSPKNMEDVFENMEHSIITLRKSVGRDTPIVIVWDSVAGTPTKDENAKKYDERTMASAAKVLAQGLRKLTPVMAKYRVAVVFVNQLRDSFGWGRKRPKSFGGHAIRYHASLRIQVRSMQMERDEETDEPVGIWVEAMVIKNKVGKPFRKAKYFVYFETGIDKYRDLLDSAIHLGVARRAGAYIKMGKLSIRKSKWKRWIKKSGGWDKVYADFVKYAIENGKMKTYDVEART